MKTTILQAETYDSTPSLVERIKGCKSPRILLVFPREYRKYPRRLDLVELQRAVKQVGAELAIVSQNETTRELARSLAIPAFGTIEDAEKTIWQAPPPQQEQHRKPKGIEHLLQQREAIHPKTKERLKNRSYKVRMIVLLTLILIALFFLLLPSATVMIYPETKIQTIEIPIRASEEVKQVSLTGLLPAKRMSFDLTAEKSIPSTGSVAVGFTKARGLVSIRNLTPDPISLPTGTLFSTSTEDGIQFSSVEDLIVPPGENTVKLNVEAVLPGEEGNVASGEVTILEGIYGALLEVTNEDSFTGGQTQRLPAPTELDYLRLRGMILTELNQRAKEESVVFIPAGEQSIPESLLFEKIVQEGRSVPVGVVSDTLKMTLTARFSILSYSEADLNDLVDQVIRSAIPEGYHLAAESIAISPFSSIRVNKTGEATWTVSVSGMAVKNYIDRDLKNAIRGKGNQKAVEILNGILPHEHPAEIKSFVHWWSWLPFLNERITIVEISENAG